MMTEEERELKDLKEKREKEKEDYYKRRKNGKGIMAQYMRA